MRRQYKYHLPQEMGTMPNGETGAILYHPSILGTPRPKAKYSWYIRAALASGAIMTQADDPKGWGWNPSVITLCLVVLGIVAAGAYYIGSRDAESKHMMQRLAEAEVRVTAAQADAEKAKQLQTYNAGAVDATKGHVKPKEK